MWRGCVLSPLIYSAQRWSCAVAQTEVTQGTPHALSSKTPTLTSWLRPRGQPGHSAHRQAFDSDLCVDSRPEGVYCRAAHPSYNLQAGFDKVATCAVRLFLSGEETPWKLTSWSCYSPDLKITHPQGARCQLWAHNFMFTVFLLMLNLLLKMILT